LWLTTGCGVEGLAGIGGELRAKPLEASDTSLGTLGGVAIIEEFLVRETESGMKRRKFIVDAIGAGTAGAIASSAGATQVSEPSQLIEKVAAAALALQRFSWEHGILAQALLDAGKHDTVIQMTRGAMLNQTQDGRTAAVGGGATDPAMGATAYWRAGQLTGDPQIQKAAAAMIEFLLKRAPRASDGTLYHVFGASVMCSDSFHTAPPALAATGHIDEAMLQIEGLRKRLWQTDKKLLSNMWDDDAGKFKRKDFWGVGNGWGAAGLARVIAALPAERRQDRERLASFVKDIIDGCLAHQRPDSLFHDVVDRPDTFVETNLAQMLSFAIYSGVSGGWLASGLVAAADRMRAAARAKVDEYGFVQGVCGAPHFDHAGIAVEGQAFFIMMEAAANRYHRKIQVG
jgi:rhamnogalacturonyl hydrolase YesR